MDEREGGIGRIENGGVRKEERRDKKGGRKEGRGG